MKITGKVVPTQIRLVEDFPGVYPNEDAGVMAWLIVKEAQRVGWWPEIITKSWIVSTTKENMDSVPIGFNYGAEGIEVMNFFGHVILDGDNLILQKRFVEAMRYSFPA